MKNCNILHDNLFGYVENELSPAFKQQMDRHVRECPDCKRIIAEFNSTLALMKEQKNIEPLPFAEARIMLGIESRLKQKYKSPASVLGDFLHPALISTGIAAAIAIGFFVGSDFAKTTAPLKQNDETTESIRTDLNIPDFMADDSFRFTD